MTDYRKALQEGFEAADRANKDKEEICAALERMRCAVLDATDGKVLVRIAAKRKPPFKARALERRQRKYKIVGARRNNLPDSEIVELARWGVDRNGYPCSITFGNTEFIADDANQLEEGLAFLLRDATVAQAIRKLRDMKSPNMADPDEDGETTEGEYPRTQN
jgi:hypothetical protein